MTDGIKNHLPVIVLATLVCAATTYFILSRFVSGTVSISLETFNALVFLVPCVAMFLGTAIIAMTAEEISRQLYIVNVVICLVAGLLSMIGSSLWLADPGIASQLLANSPEGTVIVPIYNAPIILIRDVAAFFVVPTVGSIVGAWIGSRLHPMKAKRSGRSKRKK